MTNWPQQFPRLNDLSRRSDRTNPDNYFNAYPQHASVLLGEYDKLFESFFAWVEERLERLDAEAWEQLAGKALPYVCKKDGRRGWSQLWDHLNEALGYGLLADRGYTSIRFIDRGDDESPDVLGEHLRQRALVEVKTVNCSEEDLDNRNVWPPVARDVGYGLTEKFRGKLEKTVSDARKQLCQHGEPADKRIVLLVISLDSDFKFVEKNYRELKEFVDVHQSSDVELVHQVIS